LTNEHVVHLASIAKVGTKVTVLQTYKGSVSQSAPLSSLFSFGGASEPAKPVAKAKKPLKPVAKKPSATQPQTVAAAKKAAE
ncbi:hypothetical protein ACI3PL_21290, partial [Lacticaseibacillus paracasei]